MKKKKNVLLMILAAVVAMLAMSVNVWAVQKNPLAKMPTKMKVTLGCSVDNVTNYSTPVYYNRENIEISAVSSNPKVMAVFSRVSGSDGGAKRNAFYQVTGIKEGTAKVNVTVKVNGKTYKKNCTYTFVKYANPFKNLKIGKKNQSQTLQRLSRHQDHHVFYKKGTKASKGFPGTFYKIEEYKK